MTACTCYLYKLNVTKITVGGRQHAYFYPMKTADQSNSRMAVIASRLLRWALGLGFGGLGWYYRHDEYAWALIVFGAIFFVTGFFKPRRCTEDGCEVRQ